MQAIHQIPMSFRELVADKSLIWLKAILRNEFAIPSQTFTKVVGGCACIGQSELLTSFCRMMLRWWNGSGKIQTWSPRAKTFGCELQMPRSPIIHGSLTCTGMLWVFRVQGSRSCTCIRGLPHVRILASVESWTGQVALGPLFSGLVSAV